MFKLVTFASFCFILCLSVYSQHKPVKIINFTGDEIVSEGNYPEIKPEEIIIPNQTIFGSSFTFEMHNITDFISGYDFQSNASPQQLWYDFPSGTLNAVFMTSQQGSGWTDRTCTYFFSADEGVTWENVGNVPPPSQAFSGFPAIIGLSSGKIVIANHTSLGGAPTRTQLFINSAAGQYDFVNYDPGPTSDGGLIWPRLGVSNNNQVIIASSGFTEPGAFTNTFNLNTDTFSGWQPYDGDIAETYSFSTSNSGTIGHAYMDNAGGAWFRESNNEGLSWEDPVKIFEPFLEIIESDTFLHAAFRGINITYLGETPKVVFEVYRQTLDLTGYYPHLPSEIYFWSPEINNGIAIIIADSSNVAFYPNQGIVAVFAAINHPVIGKAEGDRAMFVAFYATSEDTASTSDGTRFMIGYFMMSEDGGESWTDPERFTPVTNPPLDWRWINIAPVNPIAENVFSKVHIVAVGDPVAGQFYTGPAFPTAKFYHFSTEITLTDVEEEQELVNTFNLYQNYPNPFNPVTKIRFTIPHGVILSGAKNLFVTMRVYDILGREVATLVNEEKPAGNYEIIFDASSPASGVYLYRLEAGSFSSAKKMILIK